MHKKYVYYLVLAASVSVPAFTQERPEEQVNPLAGNPQAIAAGQTLYTQNCAVCHGGNAQGDRGPSLVSGSFAHGGSDGEIFLSIRAGIRGTEMPSFARFSNDQLWQVVSFLRSLGPARPAAGGSLTGDAAAGKVIFESKAGCVNCHMVNGVGQFEVHLGPKREFAIFKGVQDEHRDHDSTDNLLHPFRVALEGTRAKQRWEIKSLNLAFTVTLGGGSRTDCESWFIVLEPLEKTSH